MSSQKERGYHAKVTTCDTGLEKGKKKLHLCDVIIEWPLIIATPSHLFI